MAFPPNYTNVWDTTFPPDTQLANLLGQDIRNLKTDIMQRMSLLSGTFANRPTPEIVNAVWGGAGFGLLYFSTDTSQVFQWNGAAWVDISLSLLSRTLVSDSTAHAHTGTVTEDTIYTVPVPANYLGASGAVKGFLTLSPLITAAVGATLKIKFGATSLLTLFLPNNYTGRCVVQFALGNRGLTNSQYFSCTFTFSLASTSNGANIATAAIDTTVLQNITVTIQSGAAGDSQSFDQLIIR